jgi:hypothetical protein
MEKSISLKNNTYYLSISIIFSFSLTNLLQMPDHGLAIFSGFSSTLEETSNAIKGFGRFLDSLKSIIDVISTVVGIEVILLLTIVSLISMCISLLGIPKGKLSFLSSLIIADLFWITWAKSFNPENTAFLAKLFLILKTNLILLIPFIIIYFFRSPVVAKRVKTKVLTILKSLFKRKKTDGILSRNEILCITEKYQEANMKLQNSILNDIIKRKDNDEFAFSADTIKYRKELEEILNKVRGSE